jgi:hypothetical protein
MEAGKNEERNVKAREYCGRQTCFATDSLFIIYSSF